MPLPFGGGDLRELALFAKLLESPLVFILPVLLRLKRPICEEKARMLWASKIAVGVSSNNASLRGGTRAKELLYSTSRQAEQSSPRASCREGGTMEVTHGCPRPFVRWGLKIKVKVKLAVQWVKRYLGLWWAKCNLQGTHSTQNPLGFSSRVMLQGSPQCRDHTPFSLDREFNTWRASETRQREGMRELRRHARLIRLS